MKEALLKLAEQLGIGSKITFVYDEKPDMLIEIQFKELDYVCQESRVNDDITCVYSRIDAGD